MAERGPVPLLTRAADVAGALVTAVLAFTAVPAVLLFVVGNPLGGGAGHGWSPLSRDALCVLTVAAWVAWAACCAQVLRSVIARVRRGEVGPGPGSLVDWLAGRIAMGVLALTSVGAPVRAVLGFWSGSATSTRRRADRPARGDRTSARVATACTGRLPGAPGRHTLDRRRRTPR